jgi:hypothetical protein
LALARQQRCTRLDLVVDADAALLARRAAYFALDISVWAASGVELVPAVAEPIPLVASPPASHLAFVDLIEGAGVDAIVEHGVVRGEVDGLEICRVVEDDGVARLAVGVGAHDREAFALLHGHLAPADAVAKVAAVVAAERRVNGPPHPLRDLVPERALLCELIAHPEQIGALSVHRRQPPVARGPVKERWPAVGTAIINGVETVVVCSVGVDLDLVPFAADAAGDLPLVIVLPRRDLLGPTRALVDALRRPATVIGR